MELVFVLLDLRKSGNQISILRLDPFGSLQNLPEEVYSEIDENHHVVEKKGAYAPSSWQEHSVSYYEDHDPHEEPNHVSGVGLKPRFVDELVSVDALDLTCTVEAVVDNGHESVVENLSSSAKTHDPRENNRSGISQLQ